MYSLEVRFSRIKVNYKASIRGRRAEVNKKTLPSYKEGPCQERWDKPLE